MRRNSPEVKAGRCSNLCFDRHVEMDLVRASINSSDGLERYILGSFEVTVNRFLCI